MTRRQLLDERRASTPVTAVTVLLAVLLFLHLALTRLDTWLSWVDRLLDGPRPSADDREMQPELLELDR